MECQSTRSILSNCIKTHTYQSWISTTIFMQPKSYNLAIASQNGILSQDHLVPSTENDTVTPRSPPKPKTQLTPQLEYDWLRLLDFLLMMTSRSSRRVTQIQNQVMVSIKMNVKNRRFLSMSPPQPAGR